MTLKRLISRATNKNKFQSISDYADYCLLYLEGQTPLCAERRTSLFGAQRSRTEIECKFLLGVSMVGTMRLELAGLAR
jgi:hypothetical protein